VLPPLRRPLVEPLELRGVSERVAQKRLGTPLVAKLLLVLHSEVRDHIAVIGDGGQQAGNVRDSIRTPRLVVIRDLAADSFRTGNGGGDREFAVSLNESAALWSEPGYRSIALGSLSEHLASVGVVAVRRLAERWRRSE